MTSATATPNGTTMTNAPPVLAEFPVDSFRDAAPHLRRPFTRAALKFKVQATWPKDNPASGLIVAYIDARLAVERLNLVCPHLWFDEYQPLDGGRLLCRLTVDGITRHDIGEGYQGKGLYSDAFKRATVKFGVGVSLYAIPQMILKKSDGHLKDSSGQGGRKSLALSPQGEARCRELYDGWLSMVGQRSFGDPLDHGDVEGAQGDTEAEPEPPAAAAEPLPTITPEAAGQLAADAWTLGVQDKLQLTVAYIRGDDLGPCDTQEAAAAVLAQLTAPEAERLAAWLIRKGEEKGAQADA